jgi:hypothetical protein
LYPEDDIVEEDFWKTGNQVESVVISCYRFLTSDAVMNRIIWWGELRSDNFTPARANNDENQVINANILATNSITVWDDFYKIINICNLVVEKAPAARELDLNFRQDDLEAYLAEVLTIRSLCYFYLIRTFGEVPLILKATQNESQNFDTSQSSEREILDRIIHDLLQAEAYARIEWSTARQTKGRVTKNAVRSLLADVYLWDKQYAACISACDRVLLDQYAFLELIDGERMYREIFYTGNASESIFELNFTINGQANNATANFYGNINKNASGRFYASGTLLESYNRAVQFDYRGKDFILPATSTEHRIFKYEGADTPVDFDDASQSTARYRANASTANWIFYRLPDIYLMKAEALSEQSAAENDLKEALALVNLVYERATLKKDSKLYEDYSSPDKIKSLILEERRREFAFEGKRWFDLLRKVRKDGTTEYAWTLLENKYPENLSLVKSKMSMIEAWYLPINQTQMNLNKNLHQNAYYKTQENTVR